MSLWRKVNYPIQAADHIPAERKVVLVWVRDHYLPYCGYIRYAAGDRDCPYFVVYHGNPDIGAEVVAWCDCLPDDGPELPTAGLYTQEQRSGRGFPARNVQESVEQMTFDQPSQWKYGGGETYWDGRPSHLPRSENMDPESVVDGEALEAASQFRDSQVDHADAHNGPAPLWHGWALLAAFMAGVRWQRQRLAD